jgi:hypothetical protein
MPTSESQQPGPNTSRSLFSGGKDEITGPGGHPMIVKEESPSKDNSNIELNYSRSTENLELSGKKKKKSSFH